MGGKPLYIIPHLPKTAGTTLRRHIEMNFKPEQRLFIYGSDLSPEESYRELWAKTLAGLDSKAKDELLVIGGHTVYWGLHEMFPGRECRYATILRPPENLLVSWYNYAYGNLGAPRPWLEKFQYLKYTHEGGQMRSLQEILERTKIFDDPLLRALCDFCFDFRSIEWPEFFNVSDSQAESRINRIVDILSRFYFIGDGKSMDRDLLCLYELIGVKKFLRRQNVSDHRISLSNAGAGFVAAVSGHVPWDKKLYRLLEPMAWAKSRTKNYKKNVRRCYHRRLRYALSHPFAFFETSPLGIAYALSAGLRRLIPVYGRIVDRLKNHPDKN